MKITIELDKAEEQLFWEMMAASGLKNKQDLINEALSMFYWGLKQGIAGRKVASMDEKGKNYRVLKMRSLERAAALSNGNWTGS